MDLVSALIDRLVRAARHPGATTLVAGIPPGRRLWLGLIVAGVALGVGLTVGDLLAPGSEPVLAAPFRWKTL